MKLRLHGIRKNTLLLFFNMVLVLVTALLVLSNIRTRNELEESKRGFYSQSTVEFTSGGSSWEELLGVLQEEGWRGRHPVQGGAGDGGGYPGGFL